MSNTPERGKIDTCPTCGIAQANQHTLSQSAICDGIKNGHIAKLDGQAKIKKMVVR